MKRRLFIIPLVIVLLIVSTISVFASDETNNTGVSVTAGVGTPGKEVKLTVSIKSVFADNVGLVFTYNKDVLTLSENSRWLIDGQNAMSDIDVDNGIAVWGADAMDIKGDLFEVVFLVNENASAGATSDVTCQLRANWNEEIELEETVTTNVTIKNLAKITGTITSYGEKTAAVTVELLNDESTVIATDTLENGENTYEFEVEQGDYTLRFKKTKHCPREYEVSMQDLEDKIQDAEIRLYGDVTGDGRVGAPDASQILRSSNGKTSVLSNADDYLKKVADVTGDGRFGAPDASQILRYSNGKTSVFNQFE